MTRSTLARVAAVSATALAAVAGALALTAGSSAAAKPKPQVVRLSAVPNALKFTTKKLTAKPGLIEIVMTNPSADANAIGHGIAVQGHGTGPTVFPGKTSTLTVTLKKGTYTFFCPVPGHEAAGMKGMLVVS